MIRRFIKRVFGNSEKSPASGRPNTEPLVLPRSKHGIKRGNIDACALRRIGRPSECGELAAWLASSRNTYMNGEIVFLDGGTVA